MVAQCFSKRYTGADARFRQALITAIALVGSFDPEIAGIAALSLRVSLSARIIAIMIGAPMGGAAAICRFPGQTTVIVLVNALLGLPPVVVGRAIYLLLTRSGPLALHGKRRSLRNARLSMELRMEGKSTSSQQAMDRQCGLGQSAIELNRL
jgi:ABC-type Fe3+ transport system permease subunit